jgi:arsenite methyltransferase
LLDLKLEEPLKNLQVQQSHRGSLTSISQLFTDNGLKVTRTYEDSFDMRFGDGTAFLNHHFVKLGWLSSWKNIIPEEEWTTVFPTLERRLNEAADVNGNLCLTVPMAYIEGQKS